jgi:protein-S-isoprenylcysteine O-methyltransferase Ste14
MSTATVVTPVPSAGLAILPPIPGVSRTRLERALRNPWVDKLFGLLLVLFHEQKLVALVRAATFDLAAVAYTINFLVMGAVVAVRRPAHRFDMNPLSWLAGVSASVLGVTLNFVHVGGEHRVGPLVLTRTLAVLGTVFMTFSRLSLGRSFALVPADRGIKTGGAYRVVRHPIYGSFLFSVTALLLSRFSVSLLALVGLSLFLMVYRAGREERLLGLDPAYLAYAERVKYRFLPLIY